MGSMETSINELKGDVVVSNAPPKNHFKPGWLLVAIFVAISVGLSTYFVATRLTKVVANTTAFKQVCLLRNEQIETVNNKFAQLVVLFDASLRNRDPGEPPPDEAIIALYEEFREPIPKLDCRDNQL